MNLVDVDGREPIKSKVGTIEDFAKHLNSLSTKIGTTKGSSAAAAMLRMGKTKGIKPANTGPFVDATVRYVYTKKGGWIDMLHFMFYAGRAYNYKVQKQMVESIVNSSTFSSMQQDAQLYWENKASINPVDEAIRDGYLQECADMISRPSSAFSYEDLPTDKLAAEYGAVFFDPNSEKTFSEQLVDYITNVLQGTMPDNAPNYNQLPNDYQKKPSIQNITTIPVFVISN